MIRVVTRLIDEDETTFIGDFPPSEIDDLVGLLRDARVNLAEDADDVDPVSGSPLQFVVDDRRTPRLVLEILLEAET